MKALRTIILAALFGIGFYTVGCETSHTETDKPGLFGGHTHEEETTTHNPVTGTDDTTKTETKTNN
jgi:hypothetical protein